MRRRTGRSATVSTSDRGESCQNLAACVRVCLRLAFTDSRYRCWAYLLASVWVRHHSVALPRVCAIQQGRGRQSAVIDCAVSVVSHSHHGDSRSESDRGRTCTENYSKLHDNFFLKQQSLIIILVISNRNSFRVMFDKIASVYFVWKTAASIQIYLGGDRGAEG